MNAKVKTKGCSYSPEYTEKNMANRLKVGIGDIFFYVTRHNEADISLEVVTRLFSKLVLITPLNFHVSKSLFCRCWYF